MKEIGSEFEFYNPLLNQGDGLAFDGVEDYGYCFSGRTAIETVISDINHSAIIKNIKKVCVPSYCCQAMLEPFRKQNIDICYFHIYFDDGLKIDFDIPEDCQAILFCNYFGFDTPYLPDSFVEDFHKNGGVIIEDITHSLLSYHQKHTQSDYYVASVRKWFPIISGGLFMKKKDLFSFKPNQTAERLYSDNKMKAMLLKKEYLECNGNNKEPFLALFENTNHWLKNNYSKLSIDSFSYSYINRADCAGVADKRRGNAQALYQVFEELTVLKPLFAPERMDVPLFVPIVVPPAFRNELRSYLSKNAVFCPLHWPKPNEDCFSNLYDTELSLVCDQRYNTTDMNRIKDLLIKWERSVC